VGACPGGIAQGTGTSEWADTFERLIAHGHRHADILGYTLAQFDAYAQRAARRERESLRMQLLAPALARDRKALMRALAALDDDTPARRHPPHTPKPTRP
jgi:hypothetical protein